MEGHLRGLTALEAQRRLAQYGPNSIESHAASGPRLFLKQFGNPFVFLLFGAGALSFALGERVDAFMIFAFVAVNTALGFAQEYRSLRALRALAKLAEAHVTVIRDGVEQKIAGAHCVPGDIVVLREGDIIPADLRFVRAEGLRVDESSLTGESTEASKTVGAGESGVGYSQTSVVSGSGIGEVVATGALSRMGKIDALAAASAHEGAFARDLATFSSFTIKLVFGSLALLFLLRFFFFAHQPIPDFLIFAIALAITVIPEALPLVTTFSLANGVLHLSKHRVIVKRLSAIQDLGSIEILCTDKTGTLTENRMSVVDTYGDHAAILRAAALGCPCADGVPKSGFDGAIFAALPEHMREGAMRATRVERQAFSPRTRYDSAVVTPHGGTPTLVVRGAPEAVLALCAVTETVRKNALDFLSSSGKKSYRVIALATHEGARVQRPHDVRMTFVGLLAFADPLKSTTARTIREARSLGVDIRVISGDAPEVTGVVAKAAGIIGDENDVVSGDELARLSPTAFAHAVTEKRVFARITPEMKFAIVKKLSEHKLVGFLGEGINDAPALRAAHVGIVVREASDIARAAADVILLEKSLESVVSGIREGRAIFANTVKYIRMTIASNLGNFYAMLAATVFLPFLPMLPVQILLVNLLSDIPLLTLVFDGVDKSDIEHPRTDSLTCIIGIAAPLAFISTAFDIAFFAFFLREGATVLQTNWFVGSILTELVFIFSVRTRHFFLRGVPPAPVLVLAAVLAAVVTVILPLSPLRNALHFAQPSGRDMLVVVVLVCAYFVVTEVVKVGYYRFFRPKTKIVTQNI